MQRYTLLLAVMMLLLLIPAMAHAETTGTQIFYNGKQLPSSTQAQPQMIRNQVMVPIRVIVQEMGYKVKWNKASSKISIHNSSNDIDFTLDSKIAIVNGQKTELQTPALLKQNTSLIPLRFLSEHMGLQVSWDNKTKSVLLVNEAVVSEVDTGGKEAVPAAEPDSVLPEYESDPRYLEGTALINAISYSDNRLLISSSSEVKPKVFTMSNPDRIVIDLPGTAFSNSFGLGQALDDNKNGVLAVDNDAHVSKIRYALFSESPSTVRIVIDTDAPMSYTLDTSAAGIILVNLSPGSRNTTTPVGNNGKKIVVLDAGHGAQATGTTGATGKLEKDVNLSIVLKVQAILQQESRIDLIMTRSDDTYVTLSGRSQIANDLNADMFVSVHSNATEAKPSSVSGTESFYYKESDKKLAEIMHKHLVTATGFKDRGVKSAGFYVIKHTEMPATLLEVGFLSNVEDEKTLFTDSFQQGVAQAIADGIKEYLELD